MLTVATAFCRQRAPSRSAGHGTPRGALPTGNQDTMTRTLRTVTLGCKVNQYETELLREGLLRLGYRNAEPGEPAQLCLVNTCTVTAESDLKSRKAIRQLHRENPQTEIIVMGCYATRDPQAVAALPGVVDVVTDKRRLPELLTRLGLVEREKGTVPICRDQPSVGARPTNLRSVPGASHKGGLAPFSCPGAYRGLAGSTGLMSRCRTAAA